LSGHRLKWIERTVLQKLTSLTSLNLSDNQLRLFPSCIGLTALRRLNLSENCLSSLEFVEKMPQLEDLCVEGNGLKVGCYYYYYYFEFFCLPQPLDGCWHLLCQGSGYFSQPKSFNILPNLPFSVITMFLGVQLFESIQQLHLI